MKEIDLIKKFCELFAMIEDDGLRQSIMNAYNELDNFLSPLHKNSNSPAIIRHAPAGQGHHHYWVHGYYHHLIEMWELARKMFQPEHSDFTLSDVSVAILLHDLSKGIAFEWIPENERAGKKIFRYRKDFFANLSFDYWTNYLLIYFSIKVTDQQFIAIAHAEGGWGMLAKGNYDGNMLSKFLHCLDLYSSQVLGNKYREINVTWSSK